jgi:TonB family protein
MARMALLSVNFPIANHFNQSQTLKRIAMINSPKTKPSRVKLIAISLMSIVFFLAIACQDQLSTDLNSSSLLQDYPIEVQNKLTELKAINPQNEFEIIESASRDGKLSIDKPTDQLNISQIQSFSVVKSDNRSFIIIERNPKNIARTSTEEVFTVLDLSATPAFGIDQFYRNLAQIIKYPASARKTGAEGKVFVEFIVNKDGSLSDFKVAKGFNEECDAEAMRVLMLSEKWLPGKHQGKIVRQKLVIPITFQLGDRTTGDAKNRTVKEIRPDNPKEPGLTVVGY